MSTFPPTDDTFFYKEPFVWRPADLYRQKEPTMDDKLRAAALTLADLFDVRVVKSVVVYGAVYLRDVRGKCWVVYREGGSQFHFERSLQIKVERIPTLIAAGFWQ